jgi:hypothetical protein
VSDQRPFPLGRPGPSLTYAGPLPEALADYHSPRWRRHNARRLEFLASLRLPLAGRTLLELGAGVGDHTEFFLDRSCVVTAVEARSEAVAVMQTRFEHHESVTVLERDLDPPDASLAGTFDVVMCLGLLYHVAHPQQLVTWAASHAADLLVIETIVSPAPGGDPQMVGEDARLPGASTHGTGCRVTRQWLWSLLSASMPYVYATRGQVPHYEFPMDWRACGPGTTRTILIASRRALSDEALTSTLPDAHLWE